MTENTTKTISFFEKSSEIYLKSLIELLSIKSISLNKEGIVETRNWLTNYLEIEMKANVKIVQTPGNPYILAEWKSDNKYNKNLTVLFYGHYDVQPVEPLDAWNTDPFKPEIIDNRLYARGSGDNKGQFFAHLTGIDCFLKNSYPQINIKFILDGEEEIGSPNLQSVLSNEKEFFSDIDFTIISDGPAHISWKPSIVFGTRGILTFSLRLKTANQDRHSGNFGGIQPNPTWTLIELLETMFKDNKVLIKNFYDDVLKPTQEELEVLQKIEYSDEKLKEELDLAFTGGEKEYSPMERLMFRPTLNIRGIQSGKVLEEAKTIIPSEIIVEFDIRLVPNQKSTKIKELIMKHFESLKKNDKRFQEIINNLSIEFKATMEPWKTELSSKWTKLIIKSINEGFKEDSVILPLLGGSLPLEVIKNELQVPTYLIPYAQPDENNHGPNENIMISWFNSGVKSTINLLNNLNNHR